MATEADVNAVKVVMIKEVTNLLRKLGLLVDAALEEIAQQAQRRTRS